MSVILEKSLTAKFAPSGKGKMIASTLREQIINGDYMLKERIPRREDLIDAFDASKVTVQKALASLENDGFIISKGKLGTFVADKPPHLNHIALVFSEKENSTDWRLYWDHLAAVARKVVKEQGLRLSIYTGINQRFPGPDYERLLSDIRNDRLAGIIFSDKPFPVSDTDILDKPGIPRVALMGQHPEFPMVANVNLDSRNYVAKAIERLNEKGVSSVAFIQNSDWDQSSLVKAFEEAGISCPYHFQHGISLGNPKWAKNCTRMLFDAGKNSRPEALMILDDNFFAPAMEGIIDAGLSIPEDLEVITHSNFPWQKEYPRNVARLGYDMRALLNTFIEELASQRKGNPPQEHLISAVFEEEIDTEHRTSNFQRPTSNEYRNTEPGRIQI